MAASNAIKSGLSLAEGIVLSNGRRIPRLGLGTWRSEKGEVAEIVKKAILYGYRHIDGAHVYRNEKEVGEGIAAALKESNGTVRREDLFITSKLWNTNHAPERVAQQAKQTLADLGLDYVDLFLIHWPQGWADHNDGFFPKDKTPEPAPLSATWEAMEKLVDAGLVRSIGLSNFTIEQTESILKICRIRPVMLQVEVHPFLQNTKLREWHKKQGIQVTAYSPLGNISGKLEDTPLNHETIKSIAIKHGKTAGQILIRWSIQSGNICIPKTAREKRMHENADVFDWVLDSDDMSKIASMDKGEAGRMINPPFYPPSYPEGGKVWPSAL